MLKAWIVIIAALTAAAFADPAAAQLADPNAGWVVDVGAVGRLHPTHLGSTQYMVDAAPVLEATYGDRVSISFDDGAKWTAGRVGPVSFGPILEYRQSFNDDLPQGAFRMGDAVELGGFSQVLTPLGIAEVRLRHAVNAYDGWSGDVSFETGKQVTPKLLLAGELRLNWADSNFSQEYFGLKPHAATRFGLPRFLDQDYVTGGAEFDVVRDVTPHARAVMAISADHMLGDAPGGPLFHTRNIFVLSVGATYHWAQP